MNFREFIEAQNVPVAKPYAPPPNWNPQQQARGVQRQLTPQQQAAAQQQQAQKGQQQQSQQQNLMRIMKGQFTPEEQQIVNQQKKELGRYGVVFTPFKMYGGGEQPSSLVNPAFQGQPDLSQFKV